MAETRTRLNILVIGGAEAAGLATARALLQRGHAVSATACDAEGALRLRLAGALPVYPDLGRSSELLSVMRMVKAEAVVHAGPQVCGGVPQASDAFPLHADALTACAAALAEAAGQHALQRIVALSPGYLYETSQDAAKEGDRDVHNKEYAPMLAAERSLLQSGLTVQILRSGYIYGGSCPGARNLADAIKRSRRLPSGDLPASWIHEDDLASAVVALLESDPAEGMQVFNAAAQPPRSPDEFAIALAESIGLSAPAFAGASLFSALRQGALRDSLLGRCVVLNSDVLRERFGWQPAHDDLESGLAATALSWRMREAVNSDDFYNLYEDKAADAIADFAYDVALPAPTVEAESAAPAAEATATAPAPAAPAAPPPSDGPAPWNESDAKREERRRKALERKAKRAARGR